MGKNTQLNINSESVTDANPEVFEPGKGVQSFIFLFFRFPCHVLNEDLICNGFKQPKTDNNKIWQPETSVFKTAICNYNFPLRNPLTVNELRRLVNAFSPVRTDVIKPKQHLYEIKI